MKLKGDRYIDVHYNNDEAFILACEYGHINVVSLLLRLSGDRLINIHENNDSAFRLAYTYGHTQIIQLFTNRKKNIYFDLLNIYINDNYTNPIFEHACDNYQIKICNNMIKMFLRNKLKSLDMLSIVEFLKSRDDLRMLVFIVCLRIIRKNIKKKKIYKDRLISSLKKIRFLRILRALPPMNNFSGGIDYLNCLHKYINSN